MAEDLVRIEGLSKRFRLRGGAGSRPRGSGSSGGSGAGFYAVREASFSIPGNSIFGLVGESGCGKTTLARTLLYLERPTSGRVVLDGVDLSTLGRSDLRRARADMQIVFQDPNGALNPKLRVRTSLAEGVRNLGLSGDEIDRRVDEAADSVGIPVSHLGRKPAEFSGGQKQRLVLARALTMRPKFLVLDEPVSNLDVSVQAQIINLLVDLKDRYSLTYLFISHDLDLVGYLADHIAVMYGGRIVETGPAVEILENPLHVYTRTLFSSPARVVDHYDEDTGLDPNPLRRARQTGPGCIFSSGCSLSSSECVVSAAPFQWFDRYRGVACYHASLRFDSPGEKPKNS